MLAFVVFLRVGLIRPVHLVAQPWSFLVDLVHWVRGAKLGFGGNLAPWASFSNGEADLKAHWVVRALYARVVCLAQGVLEPPLHLIALP